MENIRKRYKLLKPIMNERFRRLWSAVEAKVIGHGGIGLVSKATGQSRTTISNGIKELDTTDKIDIEGVRKSGGGRKKIVDKTPEVEAELLQLIEPTVRGEPESPILWTIKSLRNISKELGKRGYNISRNRVAELLKKNDFSLQANRKTDEGKSHPDRDAQFQYIHDKVIEFQLANQPVRILKFFRCHNILWQRKNLRILNMENFRDEIRKIFLIYISRYEKERTCR